MQHKVTTYKKGNISFSDNGKGRVIVLLHGFLGSKEVWNKVESKLAKHFRVICIDLPGHGDSDCFGYVHQMDLMAKAVKAVMDYLKLKKYVIVGHSMGGYAALAFGELFADNLKGLCLFHSTSYADSAEKKKDRTRAIALVKADARIYTKTTIENLFATKYLDKHQSEIAFATKIAQNTSRRGIVAALEGMKDRPNRDVILNFAEYPIMMCIGMHDNVLPADSLMEQSELIERKYIVKYENVGHMGFLESETKSVKHLKRFARACFSKAKPLSEFYNVK